MEEDNFKAGGEPIAHIRSPGMSSCGLRGEALGVQGFKGQILRLGLGFDVQGLCLRGSIKVMPGIRLHSQMRIFPATFNTESHLLAMRRREAIPCHGLDILKYSCVSSL